MPTSPFVPETGSLTIDGKAYDIPLLKDPVSGTHILRAGSAKLPFVVEDSSARAFHIATALSDVDGHNGKLSYRGYDIQPLVNNASYEEVSHLLLMGDLPNKDQLGQFKSDLAKKAVLDDDLQQQLLGTLKAVRITEKTNPMSLMSMLVSIMDAHEQLPVGKQQDRYESTLRTMAVMPTLIGLVNARVKAGDKSERLSYTFPTKEDFGADGKDFSYARLLTSALQQKPVDALDAAQVAAMDKYLILHAEHGSNLSTFTARVVDSGEAKEGGWRITLGAMQSLAGNRHGNASNDALNNLKKILARPEATIPEKVSGYIAQSDANYERFKAGDTQVTPDMYTIEGIGHKIYSAPDPRAGALQSILRECRDGLKDPQLLDLALELQNQLKDHKRFGAKTPKPLYPNVDFCSGVLLTQYLGIDERLMTSMFAVSRNVGWQAHAAEHARDAKNIVRPEALPLTPPREFIPMDQREVPTEISNVAGKQVFPAANVLAKTA